MADLVSEHTGESQNGGHDQLSCSESEDEASDHHCSGIDENLDRAITDFLSAMIPDNFSTTSNLIQGIEEFIKTSCSVDNQTQVSLLDTQGRAGTLHVIHSLDNSSNASSTEVQRLRRELVEKENQIKELEARETHFTQEIDRLQHNMDELKEQFESYCRRNHPPSSTNQSNHSDSHHPSREPYNHSSQSETAENGANSLVMTQRVIQHFNMLGIDLKTFYSQMIRGDSILPPFDKLPREFYRHKSTKAARCKRAKILEFMNTYPNGAQACIANYRQLTASKLYDTKVKQSK